MVQLIDIGNGPAMLSYLRYSAGPPQETCWNFLMVCRLALILWRSVFSRRSLVVGPEGFPCQYVMYVNITEPMKRGMHPCNYFGPNLGTCSLAEDEGS
jgi:hypothetical protein